MANLVSIIEHFKFISKKPRVFLKIFKNFFKTLILRQNVLRSIGIAVTYDCHYKCEFCSARWLYRKGKKPLTVDQIVKLLNDTSKLGRIHSNFTGGEPLLRNIDELCEIIKRTKPQSHLFSLVTNSLPLTREKLKKLADAGLDTVQLSMESLDLKENDRIRGVKGNFDKVMGAIKYAKELGLNICLSTVVCHGNRKEVIDMANFAKKLNVFLLLNKASSAGKWNKAEDKRMDKDDLKFFNKMLKLKHTRSDLILNFRGRSGCPGGIERIYVTAYGDVMMCPHVQISYGNILKEPVEDIYKKMCKMPHLKKFSKVCKHAFDDRFYETYVKPIKHRTKMPIYYKDHPNLESF